MFSILSNIVENIQKVANDLLEIPDADDQNPEIADESASGISVVTMVPNEEIAPIIPQNIAEETPIQTVSELVSSSVEVETQCAVETEDKEVQTQNELELYRGSEQMRGIIRTFQDSAKWMIENRVEFNENAYLLAIQKGDIRLLKLLKEFGFPMNLSNTNVYSAAIKSGNSEIIDWCYNHNFEANEDELIDLIAEYIRLPEYPNNVRIPFTRNMNLIITQYDRWHSQIGVMYRNLDGLDVDACNRGSKIISKLFQKSVKYGNVNMVKNIAAKYDKYYGNWQHRYGTSPLQINIDWNAYVSRNKGTIPTVPPFSPY
jgi:hypothetical protein